MTPIKDKFDDLSRYNATLLSIDIDRRRPGDQDEAELVIQWPDGQRARLVFTECRELDTQLNFGTAALESIQSAACITDSPWIDRIRGAWAGSGLDFASLRMFEIGTNSSGSRISIVASGFEFREAPDDSWFSLREPDVDKTSARPNVNLAAEMPPAMTSTTIKDRFDDFVWHDAKLLWIEIDRRDPGHRDEIALVVEGPWPDYRRDRLVFTNCFLFEAQMNFGIIACEWIHDATCSTDTPEITTVRETCRRYGADFTDLHCFEILTSSTGGRIRIVARGFEVHEPPDDSWFPPREPDDEDKTST